MLKDLSAPAAATLSTPLCQQLSRRRQKAVQRKPILRYPGDSHVNLSRPSLPLSFIHLLMLMTPTVSSAAPAS